MGDRECKRSLVVTSRLRIGASDGDESRLVVLHVLNGAREDNTAIELSGARCANRCRPGRSYGLYDRSRGRKGGLETSRRDLGLEKLAALGESSGMGSDDFDLRNLGAGSGDKALLDQQDELGADHDILVVNEGIDRLVDRPLETVLDRRNALVGL